jgi:chemotaxis protein CheD
MASLPLPSKTVGWHPGPGPSIMLLPGQLHFGQNVTLKTLLGSCVALTLWHPERRIGGMCHYLLPTRARQPGMPLDGRFGDEAVLTMAMCIERAGVKPDEFIAHLYGGADTMPDGAAVKLNVGERNIEQGWKLIDHFRFQLDGVDVGDNVPRHVVLDLQTGLVTARRGLPAGVTSGGGA